MSLQVIKFDGYSLFFVYHSTSKTTFAPVFEAPLNAEIFVAVYREMKRRSNSMFTGLCELAQLQLAANVNSFVAKTFPLDSWGEPTLPEFWISKLGGEDASYSFARFFERFKAGESPELPFVMDKLQRFILPDIAQKA